MSAQNRISSREVLIFDSDREVWSVLKYALQKAGFEVYVIEEINEALRVLKRQPIMFILADCDPPTMHGLEFALRLRQLPGYQETPVVMYSDNESELDYPVLFDEIKVQKLLGKPIDPGEVVELVETQLK